jgi:hypothetical protein
LGSIKSAQRSSRFIARKNTALSGKILHPDLIGIKKYCPYFYGQYLGSNCLMIFGEQLDLNGFYH